jgi:hypothetical protein
MVCSCRRLRLGRSLLKRSRITVARGRGACLGSTGRTSENAGEAHRILTAAGFPPHQEVLYTDYAPPMFPASDPDGNTVILIQAGDDDAGNVPA